MCVANKRTAEKEIAKSSILIDKKRIGSQKNVQEAFPKTGKREKIDIKENENGY